ncbi:MAG: VanZ family protein [Archangium sp.]
MTQKTARIALTLLLLGIYSTLYVARRITETIREAGMLRIMVASAFVLAAVFVVTLIIKNPALRRPRVVVLTLIAAAIYAAVIWPMSSPEEKLHFLEYGTVGVLAFLSTKETWPPPKRFVCAALFTVAAGWLDEGIQALLPNRYYDLRDVGFNALAGLMALTVFTVLRAVAKK